MSRPRFLLIPLTSLALVLTACDKPSTENESTPSDDGSASTQGYSVDPDLFVASENQAPVVTEEERMWSDIYLELNVGTQDYLLMVVPTRRGIEMVDAFIEKYPESPFLEKAMYIAAISRWQSYNYSEAAPKYRAYVEKYPDRRRSSLAMTRYAGSLLNSDQPELAMQVIDAFKSYSAGAQEREWIRVEALALTGKVDEARKIVMDWLYSPEAAASNPAVVNRVQQLLDRINVMGTEMPQFAFSDAITGERITYDAYKGKVVLIDFWKSTCNPCMTELPMILDLYEKYQGQGFEVVTFNMDETYSAMQNAADVIAADWPICHDGLVWQSPIVPLFGVTRPPHTILVDRNGVVQAVNVRIDTIERLVPTLLAQPTE